MVVVAILGGAVALSLGHDLRAWRSGVAHGDTRFAARPASATWGADTVVPGDPALRLLALHTQLDFRRLARRFPAVATLGNGYDNGYSESIARGSLETRLTAVALAGHGTLASAADNLLGILAFQDSEQRGSSGPAPVERSVADFQAAVEADPGNGAAKANLELILDVLRARGTRSGPGSSGGPGHGQNGAGAGTPGRGY